MADLVYDPFGPVVIKSEDIQVGDFLCHVDYDYVIKKTEVERRTPKSFRVVRIDKRDGVTRVTIRNMFAVIKNHEIREYTIDKLADEFILVKRGIYDYG